MTGDTNGLAVDTQGFQGAVMFIVSLSAVTTADVSNFVLCKVEEDDDSSFTAPTEVTASSTRIIGTQALINSTGAQLKKFGVTIGTKRYMRIVFDETGTADITGSALAILGHAHNVPVA
jgi:hypothetical protein